ncbi:MAG: DUF4168 domain-containing protein [Tildeniella nuda ZEHNDER 1965/U140]|jgi:hypothetical protein|nr:DUF4168 domain-containing protein [Tildeniella nuda ZEHNDER 1965/U140]
MMQRSVSLLRPSLNTVTRLFLISALSTVGLVASDASHLMRRSTWNLSNAAYAQASAPQVSQYARAAFYIEQQRQQDYAEAKKIMSGNVPEDVCRQQNIPSAVQDICGRFLKRSAEIIKENGLTISQFNDITRRKEGDPNLQQQIQSELLKLQKTTP